LACSYDDWRILSMDGRRETETNNKNDDHNDFLVAIRRPELMMSQVGTTQDTSFVFVTISSSFSLLPRIVPHRITSLGEKEIQQFCHYLWTQNSFVWWTVTTFERFDSIRSDPISFLYPCIDAWLLFVNLPCSVEKYAVTSPLMNNTLFQFFCRKTFIWNYVDSKVLWFVFSEETTAGKNATEMLVVSKCRNNTPGEKTNRFLRPLIILLLNTVHRHHVERF